MQGTYSLAIHAITDVSAAVSVVYMISIIIHSLAKPA